MHYDQRQVIIALGILSDAPVTLISNSMCEMIFAMKTSVIELLQRKQSAIFSPHIFFRSGKILQIYKEAILERRNIKLAPKQ